ncbi:MAG: Flp pilus assembly protein CpaB [Candidatus Fervidibacter sp.]|uniref:Flp pilus assembly protein CpaB n=1 Tax=Candidatus Fervidibacter sp. TaxID=3100871 RepID=UPI0040490746
MRRRLRYFRLFGLMTLVFAVLAGVYLKAKKSSSDVQPFVSEPRTKPSKWIVVAATDLMPRTLLAPELLEEREISFVPEGAFRSKDEVVNRVTLTLIRKGEPIFRQHVSPPLKEASAAYLVPPGQVGMALTISRPETLPPLRVGDFISIHAVFAGMKVRTIVSRTMVLAINDRIGEVSLASSTRSTSQQPSQPETERAVTLFVALSPQEAKAIALAIDSGATFYYTLHSAPLSPLLPPGLERDLMLQEVIGSQQVAAVIVKKQHGELLQLAPRNTQPTPVAPVTVQPVTTQIDRLDRYLQNLNQRVMELEKQKAHPLPAQNPPVEGRRIIGVVGDQIVTFTVTRDELHGGGK